MISVVKYRPLHGSNSSFIPTPTFIERKKCTVNVRNEDDEYCFMWAILSALYPAKTNKNKVFSYRKHTGNLNLKGLSFPLGVKDIPKFEKLNPNIAVNVLYWEANGSDQQQQQQQRSEYTIEYVSPEREREKHINLLLLEDVVLSKRHYVWISDMSRLVAGRTKHDGKTYICNSCLHPFTNQRILDNHVPFCIKHPPQQVVYPNPNDCKLKFTNFKKQHHVPFFLVADFESFLRPISNDDDDDRGTKIVNEHNVSGFCCHRITQLEQYQTSPTVYSGEEVMSKFYEHIRNESREISNIMSTNVPMKPPTDEEQTKYSRATVCENCKQPFSHDNWKVRHHDHLTGTFRFPCCNNCNLQLKTTRTHYNSDQFFLPIIFTI